MPIPAEILAVERPKGTVVKQSHGRYLVIKRTSKRVNGKPKPVDLGTVGEIINGAYVEIRKEPRRHRNEVDIKDYGEFALCNKACGDLLQELARSFSIQDAKRIFVIAMLRTMDQGIKNRDLQFAWGVGRLKLCLISTRISLILIPSMSMEITECTQQSSSTISL